MGQAPRVRFAPSPTGPLHMGGVRTALYNYLFARKNKGTFILRIEDTDQQRLVKGAGEYIINSLAWCGITIDEGVTVGGPHAPYRQSERGSIYKEYAQKLVDAGWAYYAFDTSEELEAMRQRQEEAKTSLTGYNYESRKEMKNSLALAEEETNKLLEQGVPHVIRFKMPANETVRFTDIVREEVEMNTGTLDDKVIFKADGLPTYHLANVVDDHLMEITHVIRGEEWLPSTPLHVLLYKAFGWEDSMPRFAHLPLLLKPNGKGKLSKRDGEKMGFPVFPLEWKGEDGETVPGYREEGYLPDAFVNMLALLGWNPGTEQEFFTLDQLQEAFSLERVGKAGARFNPDKAKWFNHYYIQQQADSELVPLFKKELEEKGVQANDQYIEKVISLVKERINFVPDLWEQSHFFFEAPTAYDPKTVKKRWKENTPLVMKEIKRLIASIEPFVEEKVEEEVKAYISREELSMGQVLNALRLCMVGAAKGPHLFTIIHMIGKEEALGRIDRALEEITN